MKFDIIAVFPRILKEYFNSSVLGRAQKTGKIKIDFYNLRDFAQGKHKKIDDRQHGGGPGMVLKVEPIALAARSILKSKTKNQKSTRQTDRSKIIIFSPSGKQFTQKMARDWAEKFDHLILICGRYEGIDSRVKKILKAEEVSVGLYILTGGELPAAIVVDAVSRQIPGVLNKEESLEEKRGIIGFPLYTKPEVFECGGKKYTTPKILLSGHHLKIKEWREKHSKKF